jgi:beta-xylosidase
VRHLPAALRPGRGALLVLRGLERAQPRRLLGEGRPEGLFRALRPDLPHHQGDRSGPEGRRPLDGGRGLGAGVPRHQSLGAAVDFVTTHTYGVDGGFLDENGKEDTKLSPSPDAIVGDVRRVRQEIEASSKPGLPLYFTEWSTSYTPRDPVHDSYVSAPYILSKLKASEGLVQGMSYWTYSDLFEEPGPPTAPFEGGFGLMNPQGIRKPAWFAYKYLNQLGDKAVKVADAQTWATADAGGVQALVWDFRQPVQAVSNRPTTPRSSPPRTSSRSAWT